MSTPLPPSAIGADDFPEPIARLISGSAAIQKKREVMECELDDGVMLLVEEPGHYVWLNSTASFVWHELRAATTFATLRTSYHQRFAPVPDLAATMLPDGTATTAGPREAASSSSLDADLARTLADLYRFGAIAVDAPNSEVSPK